MSFVRAAIEAFGLDADSLLMDVIAEEERTTLPYDVPETAQQDDPEPPYGRTPEGCEQGLIDADRPAVNHQAARDAAAAAL
jgi:hypothetical protein